MTTVVVRNSDDRDGIARLIGGREKMPFTVKITQGEPRSDKQNKLYHKWMFELGQQGDNTSSQYTAMCKLHIGVPILRSEDLEYKEFYDEHVKPLPYEIKLKMMEEPYGFPVTRLMKTPQMMRYLDEIYTKYTAEGFRLTEPEK